MCLSPFEMVVKIILQYYIVSVNFMMFFASAIQKGKLSYPWKKLLNRYEGEPYFLE